MQLRQHDTKSNILGETPPGQGMNRGTLVHGVSRLVHGVSRLVHGTGV